MAQFVSSGAQDKVNTLKIVGTRLVITGIEEIVLRRTEQPQKSEVRTRVEVD